MKKSNQLFLSIVVWGAAFCLLAFFRFYGLDDMPEVKFNPAFTLLRFPWPIFLFLGALTGFFYEMTERRFQQRRFFQEKPFWIGLLVKTGIYGIMTQLMIVVTGTLLNYRFFGKINWDLITQVTTGKTFWVFFGFFLLTSFFLSFFKIIIQHFGWQMLVNLIIGKYHHPFEEYRIFMFLDMRDSTSHAEQMGTIQYSQFIQSCFRDFTPVIERHQPEVYQYVGDEVVLTWLPSQGLDNFNCLQAGFTFNEILHEKKAYYLEEFGILPTFKAGVHIGRVRVAEIGSIRRDIAYHGDVMNTTARIQSQCNNLGFDLLISEELWKELARNKAPFDFFPIADVVLKGKERPINLVGVREREKIEGNA